MQRKNDLFLFSQKNKVGRFPYLTICSNENLGFLSF